MGKTAAEIKKTPPITSQAAADKLRNIMHRQEKSDLDKMSEEYKNEPQQDNTSQAEFDQFGRLKNKNFGKDPRE